MDSGSDGPLGGGEAELLDGLLRFTIGVLDARRVEEIAEVVTEIAAPLMGAANATLGVLEPSGEVLRVHWGPAASADSMTVRRVGLEEATPMTDAIRRNGRIMIRSEERFAERYPAIAPRMLPGEMCGVIAYPLHAEGRIVGACALRFDRPGAITPAVRAAVDRLVPVVEHALDRILSRQELEQHARRLEQSNRDLDAFAAVTAHDLSAPVRRIGSFVQLLMAEVGALSPKAEGYADRIRQQTEHLSALLRDTLAYAQVVGPGELRVPVDLAVLSEKAQASMASDLAAAGATVHRDRLPWVDVEASLITQVFVDLFENAIKYSRDDVEPRIEVRAEEVPSDDHRAWWRIVVADNGIGIEPERADEVFGMFSRLEVSDHRPGTGIGLAFVKRIIERHGGEVGVANGIDGGAAIWLTLPGVAPVDQWG